MADPRATRPTEPAHDPSVEIAHRTGADLADTEVGTITPARRRDRGVGKWVWIALAVVVALLLLSWVFEAGDDTDEGVTGAPAGGEETTAPASTVN